MFSRVFKCVPVRGCNSCVCAGTISEEHKQLQQLYSCKSAEHEGVVLKLQSQLRNALDELDQVRSTLGNLEGADGHG